MNDDNTVDGPTDLKQSLVTIRAGFRGIAWNLRHIDDNAMGLNLGLTPAQMAAFKLFGDWFEKQFEAVGDAIHHLIDGLEE